MTTCKLNLIGKLSVEHVNHARNIVTITTSKHSHQFDTSKDEVDGWQNVEEGTRVQMAANVEGGGATSRIVGGKISPFTID